MYKARYIQFLNFVWVAVQHYEKICILNNPNKPDYEFI